MPKGNKANEAERTCVKYDRRNYRKHDDRNKKLIRKSLDELGAGRSVLIDAENELIAGNGVYEQAEALGIKTRVIETDGSELVIVKRTDLHTDDEKRRKLALADNATSDSSSWDVDLLQTDWEPDELAEWGVDTTLWEPEKSDDSAKGEVPTNTYSEKVDGLIYEPTGENVPVDKCYDMNKYKELVREIKESALPEDVENFLIHAAGRHIVFDYRNIAEYYSNAPANIQDLMEKSALVIIDFDKAIKYGFTKLAKEIDEMAEEDHQTELDKKGIENA